MAPQDILSLAQELFFWKTVIPWIFDDSYPAKLRFDHAWENAADYMVMEFGDSERFKAEFLEMLYNHEKDEYGGIYEGRVLAAEVVETIQKEASGGTEEQ
ncbi:hypothetical protein MGU_05298 [Metarhizium guizhouense ARSEF 977]|uniref:Uncharacterized protein n=1 Tax=Metarhizium guizhouense (strain ARSEF 977) TaxID=1276136 RepID=A0A0B4I4G9_METGA|nr:hypothetical protein MGU_05298 [Metarhizium guizhouense ARSEF 977]